MDGKTNPVVLMPRTKFLNACRWLPRQPVFRVLLLFLLVWDSIHLLSLYWRQVESIHQLTTSPPRNTKRIYIAAQHWNSARLLRDHWNSALLELVQELGIENVFVSIYESGSYDDTKAALRELDTELEALNVPRQITLSESSHAQEITKQASPSQHGWITTRAGKAELRRIPFLATLRNLVLEPLQDLTAKEQHFDTVLFLNDVVFSTDDVLRLLDTNGGDYAAACSLDFMRPPEFYDTFALRDVGGHEAVMQTWPWFREGVSRFAAERFLPVPVKSCWNGMVAMPIEPFVGENPLQFRGISDQIAAAHVEGSECCLIHADNPLSMTKNILVNIAVKVGYNTTQYEQVHTAQPEGMTPSQMYMAIWKSRLLRWTTTPMFKEWIIRKRLRQLGEQDRGEFCLVNEMQILTEKGWKHV